MNTPAYAIAPMRDLELDEFIPHRLSTLTSAISTCLATYYNDHYGLSIPEWRVLVTLGQHPGLSAVQVADRALLDKVAVSRAVSKLISAGRIDRRFADTDRRRSILTLSDDGYTLLDEVATRALEFEATLVDGLTDAEVAVFKRVTYNLQLKVPDLVSLAQV